MSPKAAAEELGYTFLPCVLSYLHRAPSLIQLNKLTAGNRKLDGGLRNSDGVADSNGNLNRSSNEEYINMKNVLVADDVDALVVPVSQKKRQENKNHSHYFHALLSLFFSTQCFIELAIFFWIVLSLIIVRLIHDS